MNFIEYTLVWIKGEMFEGTLIAAAGGVAIFVSLAFWRFGHTPAAKAMIIPLLVLGVVFAAIGFSMHQSSQKRVHELTNAYKENPLTFVQKEKERVDGFQYMYTFTQIFGLIFFVLAVASHWFFLNPHVRAVGIMLAIFGVSGLVIDFFSKERADIYYQAIETEITKLSNGKNT